VEGQIDTIPQLEADLEEMKKSRFVPSDLPDAQEIGDLEEAFPQFCPAIASVQVACPKAGELLSGEPSDPAVIEELGAKVQAQKEHIEALEKKLEQYANRLKAHQEHEAEIQKLETKIEDLKAKKEADDATRPLADKITPLDVRIEAGQALLDAVQDFWRQKDAADQARERIDKVEAEITLYDALAKALSPDGIPSQLVKEALGPVNEALAQASSYLFDGFPPLELNGELEVYRGKTPYTCQPGLFMKSS
jgi:DNA repair exonuclease SbcCD ATPase subunit